jgi:Xaa-Pro dipeptidase
MTLDRESLPALYAAHIEALQARTAEVCAEHHLDGIVVHSGQALRKSVFDDQDFPLVVVPTFRHWLPLVAPGCALWIRPGNRPVLFHHVEHSYWDGPAELESEHFWSAFDVVVVDGPDAIREAVSRHVGRMAFVGEDHGFGRRLGFADDRLTPAPLMRSLDATRVLKTAYEIACHAEANRRAARGHVAVAQAFRAGEHSELDLHLLYLRETEQDDAVTPYKGIVAIDEHAATLHHAVYARRRGLARTLLTDAGATCLGYQSDITRTVVKGHADGADVFGALIAAVDALQQTVIAMVKPGRPYQELHDVAHRLLAQALLDTGVASGGSIDALVEGGVTRRIFPHGLGHSLGVVTHDVGCRLVAPRGDNPYLRNTADIAVGQVFTVEPGCYFIPTLLDEVRASPAASLLDWKLIERLLPFGGIRIEDNIAVTTDGPRNLTRPWLDNGVFLSPPQSGASS